jgi:hypothetical protein
MLRVRKVACYWLLVISLGLIFPPSLLHEFSCHASSPESHHCSDEKTAFSRQHQHCDLLELQYYPCHPEWKEAVSSVFLLLAEFLPVEDLRDSVGFLESERNRGPPFLI